ncbi:MAG TPA: hypothetical protein PLB55_04690 [Prosthecobacter sp.]|nr:hypothetical protein [Prosthecobacter sp.]
MNSLSRLAVTALCGLASASAQDFFSDLFNPLVPFPVPAAPMPQPGQHGPWENDVIVYHAKADGGIERLAAFERAGVPTLARMKDGRLIAAHQHFPENDPAAFDKVAVHFSSDEGKTWTPPVVMKLNGLPEGMRFPFDPTLVPLPDGRVRMYFTSLQGRQFDEDLQRIHSAISSDGIDYTFEPGERFKIEGRSVIDCAVVLHQGVFHLFSPDNGEQPKRPDRRGQGPMMQPVDGIGYHATSTDGLNFTRVDDVKIEGRRRWLGNTQSDGKVITFFGTGEGGFVAASVEGSNWRLVSGIQVMGADPGAVAAKDGGWILAVTGPPRDDRRGQQPSFRADDAWLVEWLSEMRFDEALQRSQSGSPSPASLLLPLDGKPVTTTAGLINQMWSRGQAQGDGPVKLQSFPLRLDDIGYIIPLGNMQSGHTTPSDHLYLVPKGAVNQGRGNMRGDGERRPPGQGSGVDTSDFSQLYDVIAVADGFIVMLQWRPNPQGGQAKYDPSVFDRAVDLKVFIEHSAQVWSYVDHLIEVDAAIMKQVPGGVQPGQPVSVRIPVKAGQVIGKVGNQTFDFALIDTNTTREGFIKPEQFLQRDPQKPHVVDPFDYIDEPLRGELIKKDARKVPPFGGRIDYDIDGKLIGNWYEQGTGGYAGLNRRIDYWIGHLSIVYHHLDPKVIVFSIGNYDGRAAQFWVKGNQPDPATIGEKDGVVKYELVFGQLGSSGQPQMRPEGDQVQGTVLVQVLPERKLKFEAFPGVSGAEVEGFTKKVKLFER